VKKLINKLKLFLSLWQDSQKVIDGVEKLQKENAGLKAELSLAKNNSNFYLQSLNSTKKELETQKQKHQYEDKKEGEGDVKDDVIFYLKIDLENSRKEHQKLNQKFVDAQSRVAMLENEARLAAGEQLMIRAHEISKDTRMLILTTKNKAIVNAATYANLTNRLQNICTHLDAIVLLYDDTEIEQLSFEKAAKDHNVVPVPWQQDWSDPSKRSEIIDRVTKLFDKYARDKYALNQPGVYVDGT
jgi:predicted RNase H-like nuclease (RuvC/YqgF family)